MRAKNPPKNGTEKIVGNEVVAYACAETAVVATLSSRGDPPLALPACTRTDAPALVLLPSSSLTLSPGATSLCTDWRCTTPFRSVVISASTVPPPLPLFTMVVSVTEALEPPLEYEAPDTVCPPVFEYEDTEE